MSAAAGRSLQPRRDALALVREACARATDVAELSPARVLGTASERAALARVGTAVALLDMLPTLARALPLRADGALARAGDDVAQLERDVRGAREALVRALRARDAARARVERLEREPHTAAIAELLATLEAAQEIEALPPVRSAVVTPIGRRAVGIEVRWHPLVIDDGAGAARTVGPLSLVVASEPPMVRFATAGGSPHPHVSASGTPCLGLAAEPVMAALARGELVAAVVLLVGWARQINPDDCLAPPRHFPVTARAPGWHPVAEELR